MRVSRNNSLWRMEHGRGQNSRQLRRGVDINLDMEWSLIYQYLSHHHSYTGGFSAVTCIFASEIYSHIAEQFRMTRQNICSVNVRCIPNELTINSTHVVCLCVKCVPYCVPFCSGSIPNMRF